MLSALRSLYLRPNIGVTEQKVQSLGQPLEVDTGVIGIFLNPSISEKSGNGRSSKFFAGLPGIIFSPPFLIRSEITNSASPVTTWSAYWAASSAMKVAWEPPIIIFPFGLIDLKSLA